MITRIPMKGDPPSLQQIVEKYGHPADHLAAGYFDALAYADEHDSAGRAEDAHAYRQLAEKCRKNLAKRGLVPEMLEGVATAVRPR